MTPPSQNSRKYKAPSAISRAAIVRTVASSTAIETGQGIASLERTLLGRTSKYRDLKLAN